MTITRIDLGEMPHTMTAAYDWLKAQGVDMYHLPIPENTDVRFWDIWIVGPWEMRECVNAIPGTIEIRQGDDAPPSTKALSA